MANFQKVKLKDICDVRDGTHDSPKQSRFGYPLVTSKHIKNRRVDLSDTYLVCEYDFDQINKRSKVDQWDILFSMIGTVGEIAIVKVSEKYAIKNVGLIKSGNERLGKYLFYYLWSPQAKRDLESLLSGSTQKFISLGRLRNFPILLPSESEQTRIASVLSVYDDLIENNEKHIKRLEEMAQLLYTEWFVKFKFPGHEEVKMIESGTEYGKIPDGWEVVPIIRLAEFMNGYPFKPKQLSKKGFPIVKIPELRSGILDKTPRNSGDGINKKYIIQTGDILFSWSATLLVNIWNSGEALLNQHLFKVTPKESIYNSYVFYALTLLVEKIRKHVVGATMQHLRKDTVESAQVLLPSMVVLTAYEMRASKMLHEMSLLNQKNQTLSKMRDLLIPQLVTGKREIKV